MQPEASEAHVLPMPPSVLRALVPARYSAWLSGDLGKRIVRDLNQAILEVHGVPDLSVRRVAGGVIVAADEDPGPLVGSLAVALRSVEHRVRDRCPAMRAELGPVFTGNLEIVLPDPEFQFTRLMSA